MTAAALQQYPDAGRFESAVLAVLVHLVLFALLFFGVQWQSTQPEAVTVELWEQLPSPEPAPEAKPEAVPEPVVQARPEPVIEPKPEPKAVPKAEPKIEPKPAVVKPDIALKEKLEKKKKEEQQKADETRRRQSEREQALKEQRARLRKETELLQSQREAVAEQNRIAAQRASAASRAINEYTSRIRAKIRSNIMVPEGIPGNPEAVFDVVQLPSGDILSARMRKSSGHAAYDAAVERAILKSSPLPKPGEPHMFVRVLELKFRPQESN